MKKLFVLIVLILSLGANIALANPIKDFTDKVAYSIFKTAWPTAKYRDVEVIKSEKSFNGYDIVLKFHGNSRMCLMGSCPLWFDLDITTDLNYNIKDMKLLEHNAIAQEPFATSGELLEKL